MVIDEETSVSTSAAASLIYASTSQRLFVYHVISFTRIPPKLGAGVNPVAKSLLLALGNRGARESHYCSATNQGIYVDLKSGRYCFTPYYKTYT